MNIFLLLLQTFTYLSSFRKSRVANMKNSHMPFQEPCYLQSDNKQIIAYYESGQPYVMETHTNTNSLCGPERKLFT